MNPAGLLKSNMTQELISTMLRSTLFTAYARVIGFSQTDPTALVVECCVGEGGFGKTLTAKILYPTTTFVQVAFKPAIGDKVLVIGLQAYSKNMFESPVTLTENEVNDVQHYTVLGCVAVPLNIEGNKAPLRISDGNFKVGTAIKHGITINEGDDPVVRWSELKEILQELWTAYNTHEHTSEGASPPTQPWLAGETVPTFTDLASEVLAVPKKEIT